MSTLLGKLSDNQEEAILELVERSYQLIDEAEPLFSLEGRRLDYVLKNYPIWNKDYNVHYRKLASVEAWLNENTDKIFARHFKRIHSVNGKTLPLKEISIYINTEDDYISAKALIAEISYLKDQFYALCEGFKSMGYSLNNIVKLRVNIAEEIIL